jgi:hypothetical protein
MKTKHIIYLLGFFIAGFILGSHVAVRFGKIQSDNPHYYDQACWEETR